MFGDTEAYLEKHRKAARTRPKTMQKLGPEFFQLEHTKPLFNSNNIFTVHNLFNYKNFKIPHAYCIVFTLYTITP